MGHSPIFFPEEAKKLYLAGKFSESRSVDISYALSQRLKDLEIGCQVGDSVAV